jgi:hypothetical protein
VESGKMCTPPLYRVSRRPVSHLSLLRRLCAATTWVDQYEQPTPHPIGASGRGSKPSCNCFGVLGLEGPLSTEVRRGGSERAVCSVQN